MLKDIKEVNFPSYATLTHATVQMEDMGERTIASKVRIDGSLTPDFSYDWVVEFRGERYVMPLRQPAASKGNESLSSEIDLTFEHWAIRELKRWMFFSVPNLESGTASPDKWVVPLQLNLGDLVKAFAKVLEYWYGDKITISLNPEWAYDKTPVQIDISYSYCWDILVKFWELFAVRWEIAPNGDAEHYVIRVGYGAGETDHVFEYGFEGGLMKVERQVQSSDIRNMLLGRGGEDNLPRFYFKKSDDEEFWFTDPDWCPELANIYFDRLRGATFRSYIQGWNAKHYAKRVDKADSYAPWAWEKGYTDAKFDPVEFVKDDVSIAKYGPLLGGLDNNDDICPSIRNSGLDIAVEVEQVSDEQQPTGDAQERDIVGGLNSATAHNVAPGAYAKVTLPRIAVSVPDGMVGNIEVNCEIKTVYSTSGKLPEGTAAEINGAPVVSVYSRTTGEKVTASGIAPGGYEYEVEVEVHNMTTEATLSVGVQAVSAKLTTASIGDSPNGTFCVWLPNIWASERLAGESEDAFAERVWKPILGNHLGEEAKLMFTTGLLAHSDDYEFLITQMPQLDEGKTFAQEDGTVLQSMWKLTCARSDSDYESLGVYVPNEQRQGKAGDHIVFVGTELTFHYVDWAERRLDDWKKDNLEEVKEIKPTWVVTTDRVRLNNEGRAGALIDQLKIGTTVHLRDSRFIGGSQEELLYLQSLTLTYREPSSDDAALNPDVEVVLSDSYKTTADPIGLMQGEISALQQQIGSVSNVEQIARLIGDKRYLRKDRSDRTPYSLSVGRDLKVEGDTTHLGPTQFGPSFIPGLTGEGGLIDARGNAELQSLVLRAFLEVPELRFNRILVQNGNLWIAPGCGIIERVVPYLDDKGKPTLQGEIWLKLEKGEIGAVDKDDFCMGIWHDGNDLDGNDTVNDDDSKGNFRFAGFKTVYFRVDEILATSDNSHFRYTLRNQPDRWPRFHHPEVGMHFVGYGNSDPQKTSRQTSTYITRTYTRRLAGVNDWEFRAENVKFQDGDLSNLNLLGFKMAEGYSVFCQDIYMTGRIDQFDFSPLYIKVEIDPLGDTIEYGEEKRVKLTLMRKWDEKDADSWTVTREGDDPDEDGAWNDDHADFAGGAITLGYDDLVASTQTIFRFTATHTDPVTEEKGMAVVNVALRRANNGDLYTMRFKEGEYIPPQQPRNMYVPLTVQIFFCGRDITDAVDDSDVTWTRYSEDTNHLHRKALDDAWAVANASLGKAVVFRTKDIDLDNSGPAFVRYTAEALVGTKSGKKTKVYGSLKALDLTKGGN